ncbi:MAG: SDR family oxidoreductase [Thermomicrobiales bacterium]
MTVRSLAGKTVVISGAGSGMGRATALAAADAGAHLVLISQSAAAEEVAAAIRDRGQEATAIVADMTDLDIARTSIASAHRHLGRIDALVNTIGKNIKHRSLSELTGATWQDMVTVNLTAAFNVTQSVVPFMRSQGDGLIVHISSSAAKRPDASGVSYQATKAGVAALAHGTMEEERQNGIRTTVIYPGLTDTPLVLNRPTPTPPDVLARALQPEDVAAAVLFVLALPARAVVPELMLYPSRL